LGGHAHLVEKSPRFSIPDARNSLLAKKLKNFEKMDFCAQLPAFLVDFFTAECAENAEVF